MGGLANRRQRGERTVKKLSTLMAVVLATTMGVAATVDAQERERRGRTHGDGAMVERGDRTPRVDRRAERRTERAARSDRVARRDRADRSDRVARRDRAARTERVARRDRAERAERRTRRVERRIDRRQEAQRHRIRNGLRNGELTRREARHLRQNQRRIARMESRFGEDGRYTREERRRLQRALGRSSRQIYRSKHNDRTRGQSHDSRRDRRVGWSLGEHRGWNRAASRHPSRWR
jgi:hypothetical protein